MEKSIIAETNKETSLSLKHSLMLNAIRLGLGVGQKVAPSQTVSFIWKRFARPGKPFYSDAQKKFLKEVKREEFYHKGLVLKSYRAGNNKASKKVLLSHGWKSKFADFRHIVTALVKEGFAVEGIDMIAHGMSEGKRAALPEFRDVLKSFYETQGPFYAVIGHSLGGIAAGIVLSELPKNQHPQHLFMLGAPPHARSFVKDLTEKLNCKEEIYNKLCSMVEVEYHEKIDHFDLTQKQEQLDEVKTHLVYDKTDTIVPFRRGLLLKEHYPNANFVRCSGIGHNRIIANHEVIKFIKEELIKI